MRLIPLALSVLLAPLPAIGAPPTLDEARSLLGEAAKQEDPARARDLAARALEGLVAARTEVLDCWLLAVTAEAQIRAGQPAAALTTIAAGARPECDGASFTSLAAWAHEYAPDGTRRGTGADLPRALALYLESARLRALQPDSADAQGAALAQAADIALQLGDAHAARDAGLRGMRARPAHDIAVRCGVAVLSAASPTIGEGAATDLVDEAADGRMDLLADIVDARAASIAAALGEKPEDPFLLTSLAFYALFAGDDAGKHVARRHLGLAASSGVRLPEVSYLQGRVEAHFGNFDQAKAFFRKQQQDFPAAKASLLASNDLAHLLAEKGGSPDELKEALASLDVHLQQRPDEAALHETRGLLLERMGRRTEARLALERSVTLERTPSREEALARLQAEP